VKIQAARVYAISIPFTWEITHGMASRSACDSFIIEVQTDAGTGYGEALVRDYVTGSLGGGADATGRLAAAAAVARRLLSPLALAPLEWPHLRRWVETVAVDHNELPLLCGLEGALLDCACQAEGTDIYGLLGSRPAGPEVTYGATLPILPARASKLFLKFYKDNSLPNLRVKVGRDRQHAETTLALAREAFGDGFDVRVDVNASWTFADLPEMLPVLRTYGVTMIEEPFGRGRAENLRFARECAGEGFSLAADESAITPEDVHALSAEGTFRLVNIRLAKNGGILRALAMRAAALERGLLIHAGCHVGETGILSAEGRAAASLMPEAIYVDGSYDGYILGGNITAESYTFGREGKAPVITGRRLGYEVEKSKLEEFATGQCVCL
jgi:L-Ala-D/L-Glu epimerase